MYIFLVVVNRDIEVLLRRDAYLGVWSSWSQCSKSCFDGSSTDFGSKTRSADCIEGLNGGMTCLELLKSSSNVKTERINCAEGAESISPCPQNHTYSHWTKWSSCPKCFEQSGPKPKRERWRYCINGKYGGTNCSEEIR